MKNKIILHFLILLFILTRCTKNDVNPTHLLEERSATTTLFTKIGSIDLGTTGASEISAYDPLTKKLFVVNNTNNNNRIDVIDLTNPSSPNLIQTIPIALYGGLVNSLSVFDNKLAAALEATIKTNPGKVLILNTTNYHVLQEITVGALPDMITFTPNGKYILTANEGEPNDEYTVDPVGSVSIIDVENNYTVTNLGFEQFNNPSSTLLSKGLKYFGPKASFAQDAEPEYIAVSDNSRYAWVTLQENNAIARIDINTKRIVDLFPLGSKNHYISTNALDVSDQDGKIALTTFPVRGIYEPDGIAYLEHNGNPYIFSANEGDAREYSGFNENLRFGNAAYKYDTINVPVGAKLKSNTMLGRLNVTTALGDIDNDGDFDQIYTHGGRSFSIWDGRTGAKIFDSGNQLDKIAITEGKYPDGRSDDKGSEPETVVLGQIGENKYAFIALERANAIAIFDITNPTFPIYKELLVTGQAPEGLNFVPAEQSPNQKPLLIASCEGDGQVIIYSIN